MDRKSNGEKKNCVSMRPRYMARVGEQTGYQAEPSVASKLPLPCIQALTVKDTQTDSPENLGFRLSQRSSCQIKVSYASCGPPRFFFPPLNVKHTVELKDFLRVQQEDLSLATNKKINSCDLYHITDFKAQISNANLVQRCLRLTSSFKDGA